MSEVINLPPFPQPAKRPLAWSITLLLAGLAWIPTLQQTLGMLSMPMYGTMGMPFLPFLCFWTIMMAAMMLPALAPTVSVQTASLDQQTSGALQLFICIFTFLLGYLFIWGLFGIPVFALCVCIDHFLFAAPLLVQWFGTCLFISAGLYQFTPQKKQALLHCNPALNDQKARQCSTPVASMPALLLAGLHHGISCLQCCGIFMIILIAVGFMNLFWMILMTIVVFLEKVWGRGHTIRALFGCALILYGLLSFISPSLLSGLYIP